MGLLTTDSMPVKGQKPEDQQKEIKNDDLQPVKSGKVIVRYLWEPAPMGDCNVGIQIPVGNILSKDFESVTVNLIDKIYQEDPNNTEELNAKILESLPSNGFCKYTEIVPFGDDDKVVESNKIATGKKRRLKKESAPLTGSEDENKNMVDITKLIWCHPDHSEDDPIDCEYEIKYVKDEVEMSEKLQIVGGYFSTPNDLDMIEALKDSGFIIMGEKTE